MGTSSSNSGPSGADDLLPPWAPPPPPAETPEPDPEAGSDADTPENSNGGDQTQPSNVDQPPNQTEPPEAPLGKNPWREPKVAMGRYTRTRDNGALRSATRNFVRAQGGARRAVSRSRQGVRTASNLGGFLGGVATTGSSATAQRWGLRYVGRNVQALLTALVDALAPAGTYDEDAVARLALGETLEQLFEKCDVREGGLEALESLDLNGVKETMEAYVASYINHRLMQVLGQRIEENAISPEDAYARERGVKGYVVERVKLAFTRTRVEELDWNEPAAGVVVETIFREAYELLGVE